MLEAHILLKFMPVCYRFYYVYEMKIKSFASAENIAVTK